MSVKVEITAKLTDIDGNPLQGKEIDLYRNGNQIAKLTTGSDGKARYIDQVSPGTYTYKAEFKGDEDYEPSSAEKTITVTSPQYPYFVIRSVKPSVVNVKPSERFTVHVTVENDGSEEGTALVKLLDPNGNVVDQQPVTLEPSTYATVALSANAPSKQGSYTYTVQVYNESTGKVDDSAKVTVNVSAPTPTKKPSKSYWWIVILILIILAVIAYILSKK